MKLFICSDIHANVRAFDAVLTVYREISPCRLLFLGDAVGYGAHPRACLDRLLALPRANLVMGNHDWAILDPCELEHFNRDPNCPTVCEVLSGDPVERENILAASRRTPIYVDQVSYDEWKTMLPVVAEGRFMLEVVCSPEQAEEVLATSRGYRPS